MSTEMSYWENIKFMFVDKEIKAFDYYNASWP